MESRRCITSLLTERPLCFSSVSTLMRVYWHCGVGGYHKYLNKFILYMSVKHVSRSPLWTGHRDVLRRHKDSSHSHKNSFLSVFKQQRTVRSTTWLGVQTLQSSVWCTVSCPPKPPSLTSNVTRCLTLELDHEMLPTIGEDTPVTLTACWEPQQKWCQKVPATLHFIVL